MTLKAVLLMVKLLGLKTARIILKKYKVNMVLK